MLEILKFIFSDFWIFLGTLLIIGIIFGSLSEWRPIKIQNSII